MNAKDREKLLLMVLPAALAAILWFGWLRPTAQLRDVAAKLIPIKVAAPTPAALEQAQETVKAMTEEQAQLVKDRQESVAYWERLRAHHGSRHNRPATVSDLTTVLGRHALAVQSEQQLPSGEGAVAYQSLVDALDKIREPAEEIVPELKLALAAAAPAGLPRPGVTVVSSAKIPRRRGKATTGPPTRALWQIEFTGGYHDVQAALDELAKAELRAIPVLLQMKEPAQGRKDRDWTLVVWL